MQPETLSAIPARPLPAPAGSNSPVRGFSPTGPFIWGFLLRVGAILVLHTYRFHGTDENFAFGYETGRIARAIALGQGFSNPFHSITGPTAWEAPLYPFLVGCVFKLTGIYSQLSAFLLLSLNSLFSALTVIPIYLIARKTCGPRVAKWSAWTWALLPYIHWTIRWVWETSLTAFLLTTGFWLALELGSAQGGRVWKLWLWFGFLWGVLALTNPSCLSFLPFAGGWACYQLARRRERWFLPAVASALAFAALITPWEIRNYETFHRFIPIRSNAGAELRMGNGPDAAGIWMFWLHPTQSVTQLRKYEQMGESAYVQMRGREAIDFMREHPGRTATLWLKKAIYFWAGVPRLSNIPALAQTKNSVFLATSVLAWWGLGLIVVRRRCGAFLFATLLLVYPLTYYIVFPHGRYRHPIEPVMVVLGVYLISETRELRERATTAEEGDSLEASSRTLTTLSIVVPCYNEKATIREVVETVLAADSTGLQKEIVIVDDCSTDGTRDLLPQLENDYHLDTRGAVRAIYHQQNQGKGAAVRTGFAHIRGEVVLVQDADLEYDPRDYPTLLEPMLRGRADAVFGNRFHGGAHRVLYFWHYQANRMLTLFCNMLTDLNLSDMEVGYKLFRREVLQRLDLKSNRFGFEPEVTIKTARLGCRVYEVPISYHGRTYAEGKKIGWKDGVAALWHIIKYRFFD
jgi:hypothetical protein